MALSVHASPGVYALLLGSGVSIASGVKTGWGVVKDLAGRVATAHAPDDDSARSAAQDDPEGWWEKTFNEPLSYSALLAQVAPTPAARQALLAHFFQPDPEGAADDKGPTAAHRAIAQLVKRGSVRVILTTNFDRLVERALEEVGISPQVVHGLEQFLTMKPLAHAAVTVVKLHGDYSDLDQRNTVDELESYPDAQQALLDRVLDEYGLIVCGWSADWDKALVRAVEGTRSRRYPLFWSQFGGLGSDARRIIATHDASVIEGMTADEVFQDLVHRLEALDTMSTAPIDVDIAVARLKRALPDPVRRIEVADLITDAIRTAADGTAAKAPLSGVDFAKTLSGYRGDCETLLHLLAHGVYYDDDTHVAVWRRSMERLIRIRARFAGSYNDALEALRHYPALLALYTMGVTLVLARREQNLPALLAEPTWTPPFGNPDPRPPLHYLNPSRVLDHNALGAFYKAPNGAPWLYPQGRLLREAVREPLRAIEPDDDAFAAACSRFEFLAALMAIRTTPSGFPWLGEFLLDSTWNYSHGLAASAEQEISPSWPLLQGGAFGGDVDEARAALVQLTTWRAQNHRGF